MNINDIPLPKDCVNACKRGRDTLFVYSLGIGDITASYANLSPAQKVFVVAAIAGECRRIGDYATMEQWCQWYREIM